MIHDNYGLNKIGRIFWYISPCSIGETVIPHNNILTYVREEVFWNLSKSYCSIEL